MKNEQNTNKSGDDHGSLKRAGSAYRTWYIKVAYTFGEPRTIGHTVRARNQKEAERKAAKLVQGKCVGFAVYTPNNALTESHEI